MALTQVKNSGLNTSVITAGLPAGSILQTISATDGTAELFTSTDSATPETIISAAITPSSSSNKVLITGFLSLGVLYSNYSGRLDYLGVRLKRGSTVIGEPTSLSTFTTVHGADASGARPMHSVSKDAGYSASRSNSIPFHFTDSPNTTSETTYNIQGVIEKQGAAYTMIQNGSGYNYNNDEGHLATCNLTLMEIKG